MDEQLVETRLIHDRINRYLLAAIHAGALAAVSASKGRNVGEQFAHMHDVRLIWLAGAAPELLEGLRKVEKKEALDADRLRDSLEDSGRAVASLLRRSAASGDA